MITLVHLLELVDKSIVIDLIDYPQIARAPKIGPWWLLLAGGEVCLLAVDYFFDLLLVDACEVAEGGVHCIYGCFLVETKRKRPVVGERRDLDDLGVEEGYGEEK